jgi:hypothetical protein
MGGTGAQICVERGLGGIVAITPIVVEVWTSLRWNDRGYIGSERDSYIPIDCVRSCPSHQREWVPW